MLGRSLWFYNGCFYSHQFDIYNEHGIQMFHVEACASRERRRRQLMASVQRDDGTRVLRSFCSNSLRCFLFFPS